MSRQAVLPLFLSDDSEQDAATTAAHSKQIMGLLHNIKFLMTNKSTIWYNIDGCADQYKCATTLYLLSILYYAYNIVIDYDVGGYMHGKDVLDVLNATNKDFLTMLMTTVQLPGTS